VRSSEKSADFDPDFIVNEYVPGFALVRDILAIPSALASSTPPVAVLIDRLILSRAANKSVETP